MREFNATEGGFCVKKQVQEQLNCTGLFLPGNSVTKPWCLQLRPAFHSEERRHDQPGSSNVHMGCISGPDCPRGRDPRTLSII